MNALIAAQRMANQRITRPARVQPADIVAWLGAVQAQEYAAARWALALRHPRLLDADVEHALDSGAILRTHVLRPTWHFVTPADIRWMLQLTGPHVERRMSYYDKQLGLDTTLLNRTTAIVERAVGEHGYLTRAELGEHVSRARIEVDGSRLAHIAMRAELEGVLCSGPRRGKQFTYALVAERAPRAQLLSRDEAVAQLTLRYFQSHGPATIRDFVWWSGLATADGRRGLEMARGIRKDFDGRTYWMVPGQLPKARLSATVHLLPVYDEYFVAYRDRDAVPHGHISPESGHGFLLFQSVLAIDGQMAGTWRVVQRRRAVQLQAAPIRRLTRNERDQLDAIAEKYARFANVPVSLVLKQKKDGH